MIKISTINIPKNLYPRSKRPTEKDVQHLLGVDYPPIITAQIHPVDGDLQTVLVDGAHRLTAALTEGKTEIANEDLGLMTENEVLRHAIKANAKHGKQLSMKDKERAAKRLIETMKPGEIASTLSVGTRTVTRWVSEAKEARNLRAFAKARKLIDAGASLTAAAKDAGMPRTTLKGWLDKPPTRKADRPEPSLEDNVAETECPDQAQALADMVISSAKDSARELEETSWVELCEAIITRVRCAYPKEWK